MRLNHPPLQATSQPRTSTAENIPGVFTSWDPNRAALDSSGWVQTLINRMPLPNKYTIGDGLNAPVFDGSSRCRVKTRPTVMVTTPIEIGATLVYREVSFKTSKHKANFQWLLGTQRCSVPRRQGPVGTTERFCEEKFVYNRGAGIDAVIANVVDGFQK